MQFGAAQERLSVGRDADADVVDATAGLLQIHFLVGLRLMDGRKMTEMERYGTGVECRFMWISLVLV